MHSRWALIPLALVLAQGCDRSPRTNVLIVTFDTTRADHIGCYGHAKAQTPNVDRLAAEGVRFARAYSSVPITLPSHSTILTGLFPPATGVRDNGQFVLAQERTTLAEILSANGYATGAAIGAFPLVARFGLDQGFDTFDDDLTNPSANFLLDRLRGGGDAVAPRLFFEERSAGRVNNAAIRWLEEQTDRPFFLWVHYYDPHQPLEPPSPYDDTFANDLYSGEIAYADESLGQLLGFLERRGDLDDTLVIMTSDHGEGLGEHDEGTHSFLLYDSTLHVPLVMRPPGGLESVVVDAPVRLVDVMPTVLDLLEIEPPKDLHGQSLEGHWQGEAPRPMPHYAETLSPRLTHGWGELRALIDWPWKYVHGPRSELFNLERDPGERDNRLLEDTATREAMQSRLATLLQRIARGTTVEGTTVDAETRRRLEALGYIQAGPGSQVIEERLREDGIAPQEQIDLIGLSSTARSLLLERKLLPALSVIERLLESDPDNAFHLGMLAHVRLAMREPDAALEAVDRMLSGPSPGTAHDLLLEIGSRFYMRGRVEDAVRCIERAQILESTAPALHFLAVVERELGHAETSREHLDAALEIAPDYAPALVDRALLWISDGKRSEGERALRAVVAETPGYARGHFNLGAYLAEEGEVEEALERFREALKLQPDYLVAYRAAIASLVSLGRPSEATELFSTLEELAPGSPMVMEMARLMADHS